MSHDARISTRIDANLKEEAEGMLAELGLKPSQAISMFYTQVVLQRGLPFELKLPNSETLAAIKQAKTLNKDVDAQGLRNVDSLFEELDN